MDKIFGERIPETEAMDTQEEAETYDLLAEKYLYIAEELITQMALTIGPASGRCLDLCAGPSRIPIRLAKRNPSLEVFAIDYSQNMVSLAKSNVARAGLHGRVNITRGDAKMVPYKEHSFDMVISSHAFHHIDGPSAFLNEVAKAVKPTGAILISDLRRPPKFLIPAFVSVFGFGSKPLMRSLYRDSLRAAYTPKEMKQLLEISGLKGAMIRTYFPGYIVIGRATAEKQNLVNVWKISPIKTVRSILAAKQKERKSMRTKS